MKSIFFSLLITTSLFSLQLSNSLSKESAQFINAFDCFSKDDKTVLSTYTLALKYRIAHAEDKALLEKGHLEYWRLWSLVNDIQDDCSVKLHDVLEKTVTAGDTERLKKLRRVERGIKVHDSYEQTKALAKALKVALLTNPPKFKILQKEKSLPNYNLATLKKQDSHSIPKNIYDDIQKKGLKDRDSNILLSHELLNVARLRSYDQPKKRAIIEQKLLYSQACIDAYGLQLSYGLPVSFKMQLARQVTSVNSFKLINEFLPKEVQSYCDNNITTVHVTTFIPDLESIPKIKVGLKTIELKHLKRYLKQYKGDKTKEAYASQYYNITKRVLQDRSNTTPSLEGLQLIRLTDCLVHKDKDDNTKLSEALFKDIKRESLKERYIESVFSSQIWWMSTMEMKKRADGESQALKHFFDCNQTDVGMFATANKHQSEKTSQPSAEDLTSKMRLAVDYVDDIFKYYAGTFENLPTPTMNNTKAIESGLIRRNMLDKQHNIKVPFGDTFLITGEPEGGLRLTFDGIPKGKLCSDLVMFGHSTNETIYFQNKRYDGIDYILINGHKVKIKHYVQNYVERLCTEQEKNTISFVKEFPIVKYKFNHNKQLGSAFSNTIKVKTIATLKYPPHSSAYSPTNHQLTVIGSEAKSFDLKDYTTFKTLPEQVESSYATHYSPNGKFLAVGRYNSKVYILETNSSRIIKTIDTDNLEKDAGSPILYLNDNRTLLLEGDQLYFLDVKTMKMTGHFKPKFMVNTRPYFGAKVTSVISSQDGKQLYIGSNNTKVERWKIEKKKDHIVAVYQETITAHGILKVGTLATYPSNKNILIIASSHRKIVFWDIKEKKVLKTLMLDTYNDTKKLQLSDDYNYLLAIGYAATLWDLKTNKIIDTLNGAKVINAIFVPNSSDFVTVGKEISLWRLKKF